jgi:hypothetical protein
VKLLKSFSRNETTAFLVINFGTGISDLPNRLVAKKPKWIQYQYQSTNSDSELNEPRRIDILHLHLWLWFHDGSTSRSLDCVSSVDYITLDSNWQPYHCSTLCWTTASRHVKWILFYVFWDVYVRDSTGLS